MPDIKLYLDDNDILIDPGTTDADYGEDIKWLIPAGTKKFKFRIEGLNHPFTKSLPVNYLHSLKRTIRVNLPIVVEWKYTVRYVVNGKLKECDPKISIKPRPHHRFPIHFIISGTALAILLFLRYNKYGKSLLKNKK